MLLEVIQPFSSASKVARFTEWDIPRSSAWMISRRAVAGYPSRSCILGRSGGNGGLLGAAALGVCPNTPPLRNVTRRNIESVRFMGRLASTAFLLFSFLGAVQ